MTTSPWAELSLPHVLPVMDILEGRVVWGMAGQRESYRPLQSPLVSGSGPSAVARSLRKLTGHDWLYLADLDAIERDAPDWQTLQQLVANGCRLLVDAGLREADRARRLIDTGAAAVVAALETVPHPAALTEIVAEVGSGRTIFSLDLRSGTAVGSVRDWGGPDPLTIARRAIEVGIAGMIVLDVTGVGVDRGVPTAPLCRRLRAAVPDLPLITGGGVRNPQDVRQLLDAGVDSVLVASALHRGHIGPDEIARLCE